ncbi:hypothetical protein [Soonwooa sp.]|uniref:hypothetical protein n=1 Tax=Soonwooa sp. TaxID=1938592 RepID=UPI002610912B|nr:hypothetical protein [Soonwooa sp.]
MSYPKIILSFFLSFSVSFFSSQTNNNPRVEPTELKYKDCDLQANNKEWLKLIRSENQISKKIELIKRKIEFDTIYKKYNPVVKIHGGSINLENVNSSGNLCGLKILFVLEYSRKKSVPLDLNENPNARLILDKINEKNISIWILNQQQGSAIYGMRGSSGVIYLKTKNKELRKIVKRTHSKNVG